MKLAALLPKPSPKPNTSRTVARKAAGPTMLFGPEAAADRPGPSFEAAAAAPLRSFGAESLELSEGDDALERDADAVADLVVALRQGNPDDRPGPHGGLRSSPTARGGAKLFKAGGQPLPGGLRGD